MHQSRGLVDVASGNRLRATKAHNTAPAFLGALGDVRNIKAIDEVFSQFHKFIYSIHIFAPHQFWRNMR
jgi:hypothetical protein